MPRKQQSIDVYKFGGVSMSTPESVRLAGAHVRAAESGVVAVVSAMSGITNLLLAAGQSALRGNAHEWEAGVLDFEARHLGLISEILRTRSRVEAARTLVSDSSRELRSMALSVSVLRELTTRASDILVARGERMMARIFAHYLEEQKIPAVYIDASEVVATQRRLGELWPDFVRCERAATKLIAPRLAAGEVVVIPGFLGSGPDGELVTLGRGGSDFSAAIIARAVAARAVTLWKDVDGLMTADPKSVPRARLLGALHYREAAELAYYGANVLHPRTMIPLADRDIPLFVRNTFNVAAPGTRIANDVVPGDYPVRALTSIHRQALVSIEGNGMIGIPGIAARVFGALAEGGHSVSMISQASSESSICFVVPGAEADHAVLAIRQAFAPERKLKLIERIRSEKNVALIAVVGLGMRGRPGIAARTFSALSAKGVNVMAIAQGSSELNITCAVAERDASRGLTALHDEYQLDKLHPLADVSGRESKLTLLGFGQIGRALARQLVAQEKHFRVQAGVDIKVTAVADRSGVRIAEKGFSAAALRRFATQKASGGRLFDRSSPLTLRQLQTMMREELWLLPCHRPILVDLTSEETSPLIQEALECGFHVVLANKKPLAVSQIEFDRMMHTARERGLSFRYEATAGAGLPVIDTLAKLSEAGDRVVTISGCFSGTSASSRPRFSRASRSVLRFGTHGNGVTRNQILEKTCQGRTLPERPPEFNFELQH
ncbi:MAG TPA: aspartate kinase [Thermoanaerobaculia bacterium]|nr:aspartate kinase [Thermoanaerobaculia bacterium]